MKLDRFIRLVIALAIALLFVIGIAALIFVTESALNVWDRLLQGPTLVRVAYLAVLIGLSLAACWLMWRLVVRRPPSATRSERTVRLTGPEIEARLRAADSAGVDTREAQAELQELASRQRQQSVHLCFFGEISTGKSSLIKALIPDADVVVNAVGGSTLDITHYHWHNDQGTRILLTDVPGTGGVEGLDEVALEEARRSQLVVFVCDGDLTRSEQQTVEWLLALDKPLVLVMNKSDRYDAKEQSLLMERLLDRLNSLGGDLSRDRVVAVSAGGQLEVLERKADGSEAVTRRERAADVGVLVVAINRLLEEDATGLDSRRDRAVFSLAAQKLMEAEKRYREQRAEQIVRSSTRKAIIGALAAITPGTDIVIQGFIGTNLTRSLCKLYGTAPRDLDIEEFLALSQSRVGRALPLSLAVAGNGLKAFPGIGTVAGGLVHAVAYGLIFDALGRSLVHTLKEHGEFVPAIAAKEFEEGIGEHIEAGVRQVAKMALTVDKEQRGGGGQQP